MASRAVQWQFLAWAGIAILATYGLFFAGAWVATYYASLRFWALIPAFAVLAVWIVVAARRPMWRPQTALVSAFLAAFAVFTICAATSRQPRWGAEYLALAVLLTALYLLLQRLMASPYFRPRMVGFAAAAGVLTGVAYIGVTVPHWLTLWSLVGRFVSPPLRPGFESLTFGNPSAVMTVSILLAAPTIAHMGVATRARAIAVGCVIALALMVTLISGSRAGWLALAFAIAVVGVLWLIDSGQRAWLFSVVKSRTARVKSVPLVIGAIAILVAVGPGLLGRFGAGGEALRTTYWETAVRMFQSSPIVGTGPGTWAPQRVLYTEQGEADYYIPHAHNIYLQTVAEFGLLGVLAGLVVIAVLGRLLLRALRDPEPARRRMGWAAVFATVYFAAHNALDFYANAPSVLFAFAIPITWLDATAHPGSSFTASWSETVTAATKRLQRGLGAAALVALLGSMAFLMWSENAASSMQRGVEKLDVVDPAAALEPLTAAVDADPDMPPYRLALALALAETGDLVGAEQHLLKSALLDDLPQTWLNIAAIRARNGHEAEAHEALGRATRLGEQQSLVALGAGVVELELGQREAAVDAFAKALVLAPSLAADSWWTADEARALVWPAAYRRAFELASPTIRFALALESGDHDAALESAAADRPEIGAINRLILGSWSGDPAALAELEAAARSQPLSGYVVNWLKRIHVRLGNLESASDYNKWSFALLSGANIDAEELRVAVAPTGDNVAGSLTQFAGHYMYRRPLPHIQLVSWLPQLEYH